MGAPACCTSGHEIATFGQTGRGGGQVRTTTFVEVNAVQSGLPSGPLSAVTAAGLTPVAFSRTRGFDMLSASGQIVTTCVSESSVIVGGWFCGAGAVACLFFC